MSLPIFKTRLFFYCYLKNSLYILDFNLFSDVFYKYFLPFYGPVFILLTLSSTQHNFLILMKSSLLILSFTD
jgi:hypothetical protein